MCGESVGTGREEREWDEAVSMDGRISRDATIAGGMCSRFCNQQRQGQRLQNKRQTKRHHAKHEENAERRIRMPRLVVLQRGVMQSKNMFLYISVHAQMPVI